MGGGDEGTSGCSLASVTAEQWAAAQAEIAALKLALARAAIPLEVLSLSGTINELSPDLQEAIREGIEAVGNSAL